MQTTHLPGRGLVAAVVSSIGVRHDGAHDLVTDGLYLDLRRALRNPADDPTMRYRTGPDHDVHAHVLATLGALELIVRTAVRLTVACQGGRHRSVAVADAVGRIVWETWGRAYGVDIEHHHVDHPVLRSSTPA